MAFLFFVLVLASIAGLVVGLINPTRVKMKSRKQVSWIFGGGIVLFFILIGASAGQSETPITTSSVSTTQAPQVTTSVASQANTSKTGVEKACDPTKDPSLYDSDKMSLCVTVYDNIVSADEAAGMTPAQAEASANGDAPPAAKTTATKAAPQPVSRVKATPAPVPQTDNQNTSPVSNETVSQTNAVAKAMDYLNYTAFSHDGLVAQLEYDQFSHADAVYGADNSGANWNEQAAAKAKSYMSYTAFSRGGLIAQLEYDKFTQAQAEYGANAVGL